MEKYDFRLPRDTFALITDYHNYTAKKREKIKGNVIKSVKNTT